jgi:type III pantothenate kinase
MNDQMILLLDIGNTNTHLGLANGKSIRRRAEIPTALWGRPKAAKLLAGFVRKAPLEGAALCSVVPHATKRVRNLVKRKWRIECLELTARTLRGVGIDYPRPGTIGPDRLANAVAVKHRFGAPAVVVDFGTAVTFDVVDSRGKYVGGIIAPGLAAMTDYLHEMTALLPRITLRESSEVIGKSTRAAMLSGALHGYRGLVRGLISLLKSELRARRLPVVATGGCANLIASNLREITAVDPILTLEGLLLVWNAHKNDVR